MNTHIERLKALMAQQVLDTLSDQQQERLVLLSLVNPMKSKRTNRLQTLLIFLRVICCTSPGSQTLKCCIAYTHTDKHLAKLIADRYASRYISMQLELREASTNQAVEFLDEQALSCVLV